MISIASEICYNNDMITDKVKKTIYDNRLIEKGEHIIIGLSGGPDSVCLFYILYQLREELELTLHAVHVNHKIRPGAAEEDQEFVEQLCQKQGVNCTVFSYDINTIAKREGISSEDAGRRARYDSFYQVAQKIATECGSSVKIAVAQNMNDQAETILMRIMRGTGTDGLSGIEYRRQGEKGTVIIRPLLDVTRQEIEDYCRINQLNPRIDLTNLEPVYTRNRIRLELLPYIREHFNSNIVEAFHRLSKIAREDKDFLTQEAEEQIHRYATADQRKISIPVAALIQQHPAIRHRMIVRIFEKIGLEKDITAAQIEQADQLLKSNRTSSSVDFSSDYTLKISYNTAEFGKKSRSRPKNFEYEINLDHITSIDELNGALGVKILRRVDLTPSDSRCCSYLDFDKIEACAGKLVVRSRRQGDYMRPLGMKGRKKLQDVFVDEKIRKDERDCIPLVCLGPEVLWIAGTFRINENYKVEEQTMRIIRLEYKEKT